jgi:hypothetical protein
LRLGQIMFGLRFVVCLMAIECGGFAHGFSLCRTHLIATASVGVSKAFGVVEVDAAHGDGAQRDCSVGHPA